MALSITCPDCQTSINLRDDLAGKTLKCPGCERELTAPAQPTPVEPRPVAVLTAPPPRRDRDDDRPRRRRDDDDYDDDYDDRPGRPYRPRSGRRAKKSRPFPLLPLGIGAGVLIMIVAVVGVVYLLTRDSNSSGQQFGQQPPARWEWQAVPGTNLTVEMPEQAHRARPDDENPFGAELNEGLHHMTSTAFGPMRMSASRLTGPVLQAPGGGDMIDMIAEGAKDNPNMRIVDRNPLQGRKSLIIAVTDPEESGVQRYIQDGDKTYVLSCAGVGVTELTPEVKRFIDSPRFGK